MFSGLLRYSGRDQEWCYTKLCVWSRVGPVTLEQSVDEADPADLIKLSKRLLLEPTVRLRVCLTAARDQQELALQLMDSGVEKVILPLDSPKDQLPKDRIVLICKDQSSAEKVLGEGYAAVTTHKVENRRIGVYSPDQFDAEDFKEYRKAGGDVYLGENILQNMPISAPITSFIVSDRPDGLFPTVVCDLQGVALGLVYSSKESVEKSILEGKGIYQSRKRGLWEKGSTSGATQDLFGVLADCDEDCLKFIVHQRGAGFCHLERRSCWDVDSGIGHLFRTLESRKNNPVAQSYTNRLFQDPALLRSKLLEEANELLEAASPEDIAWEAADLIYFASVLCVRSGVNWSNIEQMLDRRSLRVRRRPGNAKQ